MGIFRFKQFEVDDRNCGMKIGTDSVLLGAWVKSSEPHNIIDIGCGSGILSLMCAQRFSTANIIGLEIDELAAEAARENFRVSPWSNRLNVVRTDASQYCPTEKVDLIISNPPYFFSGIISADNQRARARHSDSLSIYSSIEIASKWLNSEGSFAMISPCENYEEIIFRAELKGLKLQRQCFVATSTKKSPTRILWQFSKKDENVEKSILHIHQKDTFSPEYENLTKDFYLNF